MKKENQTEETENTSEFTLKFTGTSELDVNVVIQSLQEVSASLKLINSQYNESDIKVNIKPFQKGSYDIIFSVVSDAAIIGGAGFVFNNLPGEGVIEKFKNMLDFVVTMTGVKGKDVDAKSDGSIEIITESGEVKNFTAEQIGDFNNNMGTIVHIQNLVVNVGSVEEVDGLKILDKTLKEVTSFQKPALKKAADNIKLQKEKDKMSEELGLLEIERPEEKIIEKERVVIYVSKPDLAGDTLWKVLYEGNGINVKIGDELFKADVVNKKYSFANGTPCLVDLAIKQVFDTKLGGYKNSTYVVTKFHHIIPPAEQLDFFKTPIVPIKPNFPRRPSFPELT